MSPHDLLMLSDDALRPCLAPRRSPAAACRRPLPPPPLPLPLASAAILVLFMSLPLFDANRYRHVDIFSATFPKPRNDGTLMTGPGQHGGGQPGPMRHGGGQPGPMQ